MKHIYYKNDFAVEITLINASGEVVSPPDWQWHIEFTDGRRKYICSVDKGNANVVGNTIMCYLDNHKFCCGEIGYKFVQAIPDLNYLDGFQNLITPKALPIELWEQESDNDVNIQSSVVPAYVVYDAYMTAKANGYAGTAEEFYDALNHIVDINKKEAERVEAEANRVTAEQQRANNFIAMESALTTATSKANTATTKAEEASKRADNSATAASQARVQATLAANGANAAAAQATQAMEKTNTATELANTATANANNSAVNAGNAATEANEATKSAKDATEKAKTATTAAEQSAERANTATENADVATSNATTATKRANDISADLEVKREADYWRGAKGEKGDDGVSPTVKTSKTGKVTTIEITDANGVHTATVNDGESVEIVQSTGTSTTAVMSQKAVSDNLSELDGKVDEFEVWKGNNVPVYTLGVVNGWVGADGTLTPATDRAHTFIPIGGFGTDDILTIIISTSYGTMLNWYDNNHQFISNIGSWVTSSKSISLKNKPTNAEYICLSYKIAERDNMRIYGGLQTHIDSISEISNEISIKNRAYLHTEKNDGNFVSYRSGSLHANASYNVYKIYCGEGDRLIYPQFYGDAAGMAFYDAADNFITGNALNGVIGSITTHIVPDKCSYALISCLVVNDSQFSVAYEKGNGGSRVYEDFSVKNETIDNKAVSIIKTDFIEHDDETNLISEWHDNKYINANGVETSAGGLYATGKVYFKPNTPYYWSRLINGYYAFYKKDGTVIEAHPNKSNTLANPFTIPTDCAYGRFTAANLPSVKQRAYIATKDFSSITPSFPPIPSPSTNILDPSIRVIGDKANYLDDDFSIFNRGLCIGDSLTQGTFNSNTPTSTEDTYNADAPSDTPHWGNYSYPKYLSKISGCEIVNWGIGGDTSDEWWSHRTTQGVYYKGDAEWTGFDFAIIQLGVNDTIRRTNWSDITETAFNNIIAKLKESNKGIKIFVATIIPANKYYNLNFIEFSQSIRDYVAKLKDDDVILIDIAKYGHTNDDVAYNCGHLSAYGYLRLAMDYKALIGSYINDNKGKFRYIQFAGTELNYIDK